MSSWAQHVAHGVHSLPNRIVEQVGIALRCLCLGVAEELAYDRQ